MTLMVNLLLPRPPSLWHRFCVLLFPPNAATDISDLTGLTQLTSLLLRLRELDWPEGKRAGRGSLTRAIQLNQ